jgi:hypothetical protein
VGAGRAGDLVRHQRSDGRGTLALRGGVASRTAAPPLAPRRPRLLGARGEYEFLIEGHTTRASAGSLVYVPKGNLHAHKNGGEESAKKPVTQTPGGLHERFFEEIGEPTMDSPTLPVSDGQLDVKTVIAIATEYGVEMPPASTGK